ncbi:hypothetical protein C8F01DRAFT_1109599, partial [Mycena amicta]
MHAPKHHRRSRSASSPLRRSPAAAWRTATKRTQPPDSASPQKWDVDVWRRGKRRRRNVSDDSDTMDVDLSFHSSPISRLATTSAQFDLFPKKKHTTIQNRLPALEQDTAELARLRSEAFWSLRRSVEENGESWVHNMQIYEQKRSCGNIASPIKENQPRGRRRSPFQAPSTLAAEASDEDDDVQFFSGDLTPTFLTTPQRASSMDEISRADAFNRCPSPSSYLSDDESFLAPQPLSPASSHTTLSRSSDSLASFALAPPPSSRSEKAVAALSLALANGAGLEDYEALRGLHSLSPDNGSWEVGEMWH